MTKSKKKKAGDYELIKAIDSHIEAQFGPDFFVFDEIESPDIHIDLFIVPATPQRRYHAIFTCGMSEKPMTVDSGAEPWKYCELTLCLPPDWPLDQSSFDDERNWWPFRLLKNMARYPHEEQTWLSYGHSVPGSNDGKPFAVNTGLSDIVILAPRLLPEELWAFHECTRGTVPFWALFPVYPSEIEYKRKNSADELQARFDEKGVNELINAARPAVI